jgi:hypothetical protein
MTEPERRPRATSIILCLLAVAHFASGPITQLGGRSIAPAPLAFSLLVGIGYLSAAWLSRRRGAFGSAIGLVVGENLAVLGAGLAIGYQWAVHLRPAAVVIIGLQLVLAFVEIARRQEAGLRLRPATLLAWFLVTYSLGYTIFAFAKPTGLWRLADF